MTAQFVQCLETAQILVADGATGTNYHLMGLDPESRPEAWVFDQPDKVKELHRRFIEAGADIISIADPSASSDMISPRMFRGIAKPAITSVVDAIDGSSFLHICGNSTPIIVDMAETGVEAISISDKVDAAKAKQLVDGMTKIAGNISTTVTLTLKKPVDVLSECRKAIESGVDILAPSCGIAPMTPNENIRALVEAARSYNPTSRTLYHHG